MGTFLVLCIILFGPYILQHYGFFDDLPNHQCFLLARTWVEIVGFLIITLPLLMLLLATAFTFLWWPFSVMITICTLYGVLFYDDWPYNAIAFFQPMLYTNGFIIIGLFLWGAYVFFSTFVVALLFGGN